MDKFQLKDKVKISSYSRRRIYGANILGSIIQIRPESKRPYLVNLGGCLGNFSPHELEKICPSSR